MNVRTQVHAREKSTHEHTIPLKGTQRSRGMLCNGGCSDTIRHLGLSYPVLERDSIIHDYNELKNVFKSFESTTLRSH